jgi:hypothetical protein
MKRLTIIRPPAKLPLLLTVQLPDPAVAPFAVTEISHGNERVFTFFRHADGSLALNRAGLVEEGYRTLPPPADTDAAEEYYYLTPGVQAVSLRGKAYRDFPWGRAVVSTWDGPVGSPATTYTYETDPASPDHGRCMGADQPGGAWERYMLRSKLSA